MFRNIKYGQFLNYSVHVPCQNKSVLNIYSVTFCFPFLFLKFRFSATSENQTWKHNTPSPRLVQTTLVQNSTSARSGKNPKIFI